MRRVHRIGNSLRPGCVLSGTLALHCSALDLSASRRGERRVDAPLPAALRARLDVLALTPWAQALPPW